MIATEILALYPTPDPMTSEEQADRFAHGDVATLTEHDLQREITALRLLNFCTDSEWHREREVRVLEELTRRGSL